MIEERKSGKLVPAAVFQMKINIFQKEIIILQQEIIIFQIKNHHFSEHVPTNVSPSGPIGMIPSNASTASKTDTKFSLNRPKMMALVLEIMVFHTSTALSTMISTRIPIQTMDIQNVLIYQPLKRKSTIFNPTSIILNTKVMHFECKIHHFESKIHHLNEKP